jgi:hypothetical protein
MFLRLHIINLSNAGWKMSGRVCDGSLGKLPSSFTAELFSSFPDEKFVPPGHWLHITSPSQYFHIENIHFNSSAFLFPVLRRFNPSMPVWWTQIAQH